MSLTQDTFEAELHARLGREYRLRRSPFRNSWLIEQRVGRGAFEVPDTLDSDAAIRVKDGYALVVESQVTDTMPCRVCGAKLAVPVMRTAEMKCKRCELLYGKATRMFAGYYPLSETLLQRLESTSPKRGNAWVGEMRSTNNKLKATAQRDHDNYVEAVARDTFSRVMDIPQTAMWNGSGSIPSRV